MIDHSKGEERTKQNKIQNCSCPIGLTGLKLLIMSNYSIMERKIRGCF